ncbi:restriction endonuclease subunit S [Streptomyces sp. NPDC007988]|uniref:restriction endonuclease subunit S n=1 Tax=Streptomyces sp. NPDC007988 TaxID=3364802 RepID=UPI0036E61FC5
MNTSAVTPPSLKPSGTYELVRLGYVARLQNGLTVDAKRDVTGDVVTSPYLRVANVQAGSLDLESVTEITVPRSVAQRCTLRPGDVLMTEGGDLDKLGRGTVWQGELDRCLHQNHIFAVRPDPQRLSGRFLAYVTQSLYGRHYFESTGTRTTNLASTNSSKIQSFPLPLPPLNEQRRIADFLDVETARIDRLAQLRSRSLDLLSEQAVARVDSAIRGGSTGRTKQAEYSPLGQIPAHWREGRLRSVDCDVQTGPFGSQLHAEDYVADGWPVINPANITPSGLTADDRVTVSSETRERLARHILQADDVIFGRRGELGRAGVVSTEQAGWVCGTGSLRVRFREHAFHPGYLHRYLTIPAVRHYFQLHAIGSTMANLNTSILLNMPLLLPERRDQVFIAQACDEIEEQTANRAALVKRQLALLAERRQALITAAVTGQFDVSTASGRNVTDGVTA